MYGKSTAIAGFGTSLSVTVMTDGGDDALQDSCLAEELVESMRIEELESTVRTEFAEVVAKDTVCESKMKSKRILGRVNNTLMYFRKNATHNLTFNE